MLGDYLFHLDGRDILATRNDHILCTVTLFDVAIGMPDTNVARVKPPTLKCYSRAFLVPIVAHHHVVPIHHHLTHCLTITRHISHHPIDHTDGIRDHITLTLSSKEACLFS